MYMMTIKPGMKTRKKTAFRVYDDMPAELAAELTLLLHAYDVFPVILQNLRPSGVLFSKETLCEKFQIAREKVVVTVTTTFKSGGDSHHRHIQSWFIHVHA